MSVILEREKDVGGMLEQAHVVVTFESDWRVARCIMLGMSQTLYRAPTYKELPPPPWNSVENPECDCKLPHVPRVLLVTSVDWVYFAI